MQGLEWEISSWLCPHFRLLYLTALSLFQLANSIVKKKKSYGFEAYDLMVEDASYSKDCIRQQQPEVRHVFQFPAFTSGSRETAPQNHSPPTNRVCNTRISKELQHSILGTMVWAAVKHQKAKLSVPDDGCERTQTPASKLFQQEESVHLGAGHIPSAEQTGSRDRNPGFPVISLPNGSSIPIYFCWLGWIIWALPRRAAATLASSYFF